MLLPFNLSTFPILRDTSFVYGIVVVALLTFLLVRSKNIRRNYVMLGSLWLLLFLAPALLRTATDYESVFLEHRLYFPIIGFFILFLETDFVKNISLRTTPSKIVVAACSIIFITLSYYHSSHYKNEYNYWKNAVATSPHSSFAHKGLGTFYLANEKPGEAKKEYGTALELNPDIKEVRNNLGRIYLNNKEYDKAEQLLREELKINQDNAVTWYNLGLLHLDKKNISEAESLINKALEIDPDYLDAQNDLCVILAMQQRHDEAARLCIKILEENPDYESAKKNLALIFSAWKNPERVRYYRKVLEEKGIVVD